MFSFPCFSSNAVCAILLLSTIYLRWWISCTLCLEVARLPIILCQVFQVFLYTLLNCSTLLKLSTKQIIPCCRLEIYVAQFSEFCSSGHQISWIFLISCQESVDYSYQDKQEIFQSSGKKSQKYKIFLSTTNKKLRGFFRENEQDREFIFNFTVYLRCHFVMH